MNFFFSFDCKLSSINGLHFGCRQPKHCFSYSAAIVVSAYICSIIAAQQSRGRHFTVFCICDKMEPQMGEKKRGKKKTRLFFISFSFFLFSCCWLWFESVKEKKKIWGGEEKKQNNERMLKNKSGFFVLICRYIF